MMKIVAIAALLGGIVLLGMTKEDAISLPWIFDRGNCVENCG